jgi:uncharacterized protein (DUF2062 family)
MTAGPWKARLAALFHIDDSPWRTALALAVGVFISFTPFWGFQTVLALLTATVFRLNRGVTVLGTWLNLPWFAPFVYAGAVKLGALLLPDLSGIAAWSVWLLVGSMTIGFGAAVVTWVVAFGVMRVRQRRQARATGESQSAA